MKLGKKSILGLTLTFLTAIHLSGQSGPPFSQFILQLLGVRPGMTVADVGAGRGDLAFLLAESVGIEGHVIANEISDDRIEMIEKTRRKRGVSNLTVVRGTVEDPLLPVEVDYLLMVDVYHHLAKPDGFMKNLQMYLKPTGRLVVAAVLNKRNPRARPSTSGRADPCVSDPEETRAAIEKTGFVFEKVVFHDDPDRNFFWPTSYVLFFRLPEAD